MTKNDVTWRPAPPRRQPMALIVALALFAGCTEEAPLAPDAGFPLSAYVGTSSDVMSDAAMAALRLATARYHRLDAAIHDGFVLLHPCEERPGAGPAGILYVHFDRLLDGVIDPEKPDALLYEPTRNGRERLVAAEFAIPYAMWNDADPPEFLGASFQREDEFEVWALHVWLWRHNPNGVFAESNPNISCAS